MLALTASTVASGAPFNNIATIQTGVPHITNLDAETVNSTLHLLAFSSDITGGTSITAGGTPHLHRQPSGLTSTPRGKRSNFGGSAVAGSRWRVLSAPVAITAF